MPQVTGVIKVKVDGDTHRVKPGVSFDPGGMERTAILANGVVVGFSEKPVAATLEYTIAHTKDFKLIKTGKIVDATINIETDTGVRFTMGNAFLTNPAALKDGEGDVTLKWSGPAAEEK
jgi:hypothetical protein